jgi:hypothetical protein
MTVWEALRIVQDGAANNSKTYAQAKAIIDRSNEICRLLKILPNHGYNEICQIADLNMARKSA